MMSESNNVYILHRYSAAIVADFDVILNFLGIYEKENLNLNQWVAILTISKELKSIFLFISSYLTDESQLISPDSGVINHFVNERTKFH